MARARRRPGRGGASPKLAKTSRCHLVHKTVHMNRKIGLTRTANSENTSVVASTYPGRSKICLGQRQEISHLILDIGFCSK